MNHLPEAFIARIANQLGKESEAFFASFNNDTPVSVRINPFKLPKISFVECVPWCATGYYLPKRPVFTLDPLFHAGTYYVQEASSMFLEQAIMQLGLNQRSISVLDLCASPGGKTTHLASLLKPNSLLVSNEVISSRVAALKENVIKWGSGNVVITQNDASHFGSLPGFFDLMVIDAPCSGEGLFRKDVAAVNQWSVQSGEVCAARQRRIVLDALPSLKEGGYLIYSTCTYHPTENDENIRWLIGETGMQAVPHDVTTFDGVVQTEFGAAFYPHRIRGEGFYLAVLQKINGHGSAAKGKIKNVLQPLPDEFSEVGKWLVHTNSHQLFKWNDRITALPGTWIDALNTLYQKLQVKYASVDVAQVKGNDLLPEHALSMFAGLNTSYFTGVELSEQEALNYLRKELFAIPLAPRGFILAMHKNIPLGWIKNLGSRINNYYPTEWRIRMR